MKVKIFTEIYTQNMEEEFNKWAKGKALTKDIIIHTTTVPATQHHDSYLVIAVYYPEGSQFDTEA